jgi:pimeloyl-ACP methyl ester carboxylesterase
MARFVLVHGAWHGGWCWSDVVGELEALGHTALAPDLPCDDVTKDQFEYAALLGDCSDAIVVGHSLGAQTIVRVNALRHVYLAALLPVADANEHAFVETFGGFVRDEADRSYWPDADTAAERMYPDCTRDQSDRAFAQLRPQARIANIPRPFAPGDVVIATAHDAAIDFAWQVRTANEHGLGVIELDAGHSPFLTQPAELASLLSTLA